MMKIVEKLLFFISVYQNGAIPVMAQMPQNQAAVPVTSESNFQNAYQPQQSPLPQTAAGAPATIVCELKY